MMKILLCDEKDYIIIRREGTAMQTKRQTSGVTQSLFPHNTNSIFQLLLYGTMPSKAESDASLAKNSL